MTFSRLLVGTTRHESPRRGNVVTDVTSAAVAIVVRHAGYEVLAPRLVDQGFRKLRRTGAGERQSPACPRRAQDAQYVGMSAARRCARPQIGLRVARNQAGSERCSRRSVRDRRRRPWSSGRASAAIATVQPSRDIVVLKQPAFASSGATSFDLGAKPLIVVYRAGQQVERNLVYRSPRLCGQAGQLCFEIRRNLQVHETSVGCIDGAVNRRLTPRAPGAACAIGGEGV